MPLKCVTGTASEFNTGLLIFFCPYKLNKHKRDFPPKRRFPFVPIFCASGSHRDSNIPSQTNTQTHAPYARCVTVTRHAHIHSTHCNRWCLFGRLPCVTGVKCSHHYEQNIVQHTHNFTVMGIGVIGASILIGGLWYIYIAFTGVAALRNSLVGFTKCIELESEYGHYLFQKRLTFLEKLERILIWFTLIYECYQFCAIVFVPQVPWFSKTFTKWTQHVRVHPPRTPTPPNKFSLSRSLSFFSPSFCSYPMVTPSLLPFG